LNYYVPNEDVEIERHLLSFPYGPSEPPLATPPGNQGLGSIPSALSKLVLKSPGKCALIDEVNIQLDLPSTSNFIVGI